MVNQSTTKINLGKSFLVRLESLIEQNGVDGKKLALGTGLSPASVHKYRKKGAMPGSLELARLADYFGVTTDWLLGRAEQGIGAPAVMEGPAHQVVEDLLNAVEELKEKISLVERSARKLRKSKLSSKSSERRLLDLAARGEPEE